MEVFRTIVGVIVGYLVYAVSSMLLVGLVAAVRGPLAVGLGLLLLVAIGLIAGWVTARISGVKRRWAGITLAVLVVAATVANLVLRLGAEPDWFKVGTLLLTVPAILCTTLRDKDPQPAA